MQRQLALGTRLRSSGAYQDWSAMAGQASIRSTTRASAPCLAGGPRDTWRSSRALALHLKGGAYRSSSSPSNPATARSGTLGNERTPRERRQTDTRRQPSAAIRPSLRSAAYAGQTSRPCRWRYAGRDSDTADLPASGRTARERYPRETAWRRHGRSPRRSRRCRPSLRRTLTRVVRQSFARICTRGTPAGARRRHRVAESDFREPQRSPCCGHGKDHGSPAICTRCPDRSRQRPQACRQSSHHRRQ